MRTYILLIVLLIVSLSAYGQFNEIKTTKIGVEELPDSIKIKGRVIEILTWNDTIGINYFISSAIRPIRKRFEDHEDEETKHIFAEQYIVKDDNIELLWNFDLKRTGWIGLELLFIPHSTYISDLDNNGITETTFVYKTASRSDISPADIELIMHENENKYSLKGRTFIRYSKHLMDVDFSDYELNLEKIEDNKIHPSTKNYGRYLNDDEFIKTPNQFLLYAIDIWKKHIEEKF